MENIINISQPTTLPNYQVKLILSPSNFSYSSLSSINGDDIRFVDLLLNNLSYYIESWNYNGTSIIWIKIINANTSLIKIIYGTPLPPTSDPNSTFTMFDHFDDGTIDTNKWSYIGTVSESSSEIVIGGNVLSRVWSKNIYQSSAIRFYGKLNRNPAGIAVGGYYYWNTDVQSSFRIQSLAIHVARCKEAGIITDVNITDYNNLYKVYEIQLNYGIESKFYVDNSIVADITTNVPSTNINAHFLAYTDALISIDWAHIREYDGIDRTLTIGSITCATPTCNLLVT